MPKDYLQQLPHITRQSVSVDNITPLRFGVGEDNTFVASFMRMLKIMGRNVDYWYLMAVSGAAFRLQIHCHSWRMNSPDILTGFDLTPYIFNAFGVECKRVWVCSDDNNMKESKKLIIQNIERGWPSIGLSMDGKTYHGLIIGLTVRDKLLAIDYSIPGMPHAVAEKLVWCYHIPTKVTEPMSSEQQFIQAFSLAHDLYTTEREKTFHLGINAYDYWYSTLTNPSHHNPYKNDWLTIECNNGNYWIFVNLVDAKKCAAKFCSEMIKKFPEHAKQLAKLTALYDSMITTLQPLLDKRVVRPHKDINPARPWTKHERRKQALKLMQVKELELEALDYINEINTSNSHSVL